MKAILYLFICLYGIAVGNFLNVCIYKVFVKKNVVFPHPHDRKCHPQLKWQGVMVYPLIQGLNGLCYFFVVCVNGFTVTSLLYCLCLSALLAVSVIDWKLYEIPVLFPLFIVLLGAVRVITDLQNWGFYIVGFFSVSGFLLLIYLFTRGRGIGGGDVKLMASTGLLLGWKLNFFAFFLACLSGSLVYSIFMRWRGKRKTLAFAPHLSFGVILAMLIGERVIQWYLV